MKLRQDMSYIQEQVANKGYAYAKVEPTYSKNEKDNSVSIRYVVRAGQKVRINDVIISGNHSTKDRISHGEIMRESKHRSDIFASL